MNTIRLASSALLGVLLLQHAFAQVPHLISYQGRITAHGTNFDGTGLLKFAFVSGATNAATQATASATLVYGFLVQITVTSAGSGYTAPPAVTITDPTGSGAVAVGSGFQGTAPFAPAGRRRTRETAARPITRPLPCRPASKSQTPRTGNSRTW